MGGASCPSCGLWSVRVHGSYLRFPRDLPTAGQHVVLSLRVRRFSCRESACPRGPLPSRYLASPAGTEGEPNGCARPSRPSALPWLAVLAPGWPMSSAHR
ncbi:transposase family protein, partial [Streptomyces katrae]|uniref:transposase family protein n=1 Tax=Streptomyces katrae TaxID=68223 RepID=UPI001FDF8CBF